MSPWRKPFFSEKKETKKSRLQEKGEYALPGPRRSDHDPGRLGQKRPSVTELELHGDPSDHANQEIDGKYLRPEAGRFVVTLVLTADGNGFERDDQQRQAHGQLRK